MKKPSKKQLTAIIFWVLTAVCFGIIFYFSACPADESSMQSDWILKIIYSIFGESKATAFIVRKLAHFLEYTGTSLIMSAAFYFTFDKNRIYLPIIFTSLCAATDEFHQRFVAGRSCELRDWAIDTLGAVLGALIFTAIVYIIKKIKAHDMRRDKK